MANLRGTLTPTKLNMSSGPTVSRLAGARLDTYLKTWNTEVMVRLMADGEVGITLRRNGKTIQEFGYPAEPAVDLVWTNLMDKAAGRKPRHRVPKEEP